MSIKVHFSAGPYQKTTLNLNLNLKLINKLDRFIDEDKLKKAVDEHICILRCLGLQMIHTTKTKPNLNPNAIRNANPNHTYPAS